MGVIQKRDRFSEERAASSQATKPGAGVNRNGVIRPAFPLCYNLAQN